MQFAIAILINAAAWRDRLHETEVKQGLLPFGENLVALKTAPFDLFGHVSSSMFGQD